MSLHKHIFDRHFNALLAEVDGVEARAGVILLAACNDASRLDPALIRSGRLDRLLRVGPPNQEALVAMLREHLDADLKDDDLTPAAIGCAGATGADVERLVRGARHRARNAGRVMRFADLLDEIRGRTDMTPEDLWISAVHEAGHAVACHVLSPGSLRGVNLTGSQMIPGTTLSSIFLTKQSIQARLLTLLAGRAAEEVLLGTVTSGAGGAADSDLALATKLIAAALTSLGLEPDFGMAWRSSTDMADLPRLLRDVPGLGSAVDDGIRATYRDALDIVRRHTAAVVAVAEVLIEKRAIAGDAVARLVDVAPDGDVPCPSVGPIGLSDRSQP